MQRYFRRITLGVLAALFILSASVRAAEPLERFVPGNYDATIFVNARQWFDAPELASLRDKLMNEQRQAFINNLRTMTGMDVTKDLDAIVMAVTFDGARKNDHLLLVEGRIKPEGILAMFRGVRDFKEIPVGTGKLYEYFDQDSQELRSTAFPAPDMAVFGHRAAVEAVLNPAQPGQRLIDKPAYKARLGGVDANSFFHVVALAPPAAAAKDAVGRDVIGSTRALALSGVLAGQLTLRTSLATADDNAAAQWRQMVQGALAFAQLLKDQPRLGDLAKRVTVDAKGADVTTALTLSVPEARELLAMNPKLNMLKE